MIKVMSSRVLEKNSKSILGKRRLDYSYNGYISSATRPPLASPRLEENSGVEKDVKAKERSE